MQCYGTVFLLSSMSKWIWMVVVASEPFPSALWWQTHIGVHLKLSSEWLRNFRGFTHGSVGKESACSAGDLGSIPGWGRSPGEGNGNPLQYPGKIPWTEEPGGLQSTGSQRVGHEWATNNSRKLNVIVDMSIYQKKSLASYTGIEMLILREKMKMYLLEM